MNHGEGWQFIQTGRFLETSFGHGKNYWTHIFGSSSNWKSLAMDSNAFTWNGSDCCEAARRSRADCKVAIQPI